MQIIVLLVNFKEISGVRHSIFLFFTYTLRHMLKLARLLVYDFLMVVDFFKYFIYRDLNQDEPNIIKL